LWASLMRFVLFLLFAWTGLWLAEKHFQRSIIFPNSPCNQSWGNACPNSLWQIVFAH
jgi:hypothetical protein